MASENNIKEQLLNSSSDGDMEGVIAALEQGGRVTRRDRRKLTPLLAASQNGHTDICGILLAYGSDVNEMHPKSKQTALHLAGGKGYF